MQIFDIAGRAMSAQLQRLNASASNLANSGAVAGSADDAYRALKPVFRTIYAGSSGRATVQHVATVRANLAPERRHEPGHPLADAQGYVHMAAVDPNAELVEIVEAARQYSSNVQVAETGKALILETLRLGR